MDNTIPNLQSNTYRATERSRSARISPEFEYRIRSPQSSEQSREEGTKGKINKETLKNPQFERHEAYLYHVICKCHF